MEWAVACGHTWRKTRSATSTHKSSSSLGRRLYRRDCLLRKLPCVAWRRSLRLGGWLWSIARAGRAQTAQLLSKGLNLEFRSVKLVPRLIIGNMVASMWFWVDICGFSILYGREEEGFAYLDLNGSQVILEVFGDGRMWINEPLDALVGGGASFEVEALQLNRLLEKLALAGWPLFLHPEDRWYHREAVEVGVRQFLVRDPDGYLLRFQASLGERPFAG